MPAGLVQGTLRTYEAADSIPVVFDRVFIATWLALSVGLAAFVLVSAWRLTRERRRWQRSRVAGKDVLVSDCVGPAVVGVFRHAVVVPTWVLGLTPDLQRIVTEHEHEHLRAGDLRHSLIALLLILLVPWNPVLWWQLSRLKLALEADCDQRVIRNGVDFRTYGRVLLELAGRKQQSPLPTLALTEKRSSLSRRIEMMAKRPNRRFYQVAGAVAVSAVLIFIACETPLPPNEGADGDVSLASSSEAGQELPVYVETSIDEPPQRVSSPPIEYPKLLQQAGIEGKVVVTAIVGVDGDVEAGSVEILSSTHEAFDASARNLVARSRFVPGKVDGRPVRVRIELPIQFSLFTGAAVPRGPQGGVRSGGVQVYTVK
jgi:TonB family protein